MKITAAQEVAFINKPKRMDNDIWIDVRNKEQMDSLWNTARSQDWWADDANIGYVGNHKGVHYFQIPGLTTGFAGITL